MKKISPFHLMLFATGGMIGSGWLFSPFYGFQTAGVWVILSWIITAGLTFIIALSFAETACILPIVGGVSRFIGTTHSKTIGFIFLLLGWLSLVVYLPLEAQSAIQYLGFWWHDLITHDGNRIILSHYGLVFAIIIMFALTLFNCFLISKVTKINTIMGLWKIFIPVLVALFFIICFGKTTHIQANLQQTPFSWEKVLLAITSSGLAFAFTGFQNGIVMAEDSINPKKSLPLSLFSPIIIGSMIYILLSLSFICCISNPAQISKSAIAPLLGLVTLLGINLVYIILFADAILAPLGTANVYTAVTGRTLYSLALDFMPHSILSRLNRHNSPYIALWTSTILGLAFLLPFPTWSELVDFLSSVVVFGYMAGPVTLMVLRRKCPELRRDFRLSHYQLIGYLGFICCSLFIYWSGYKNLWLLLITLILVILFYSIITQNIMHTVTQSLVLVVYVLALAIVSQLHHLRYIAFPYDNLLVILIALLCCRVMVDLSLSSVQIKNNLKKLNHNTQQNNSFKE